MNKIPCLFKREGAKVIDKVTPGCEWVLAGEGKATEKLDGTNVRLTVRYGRLVRVEKRRNPTRAQKALGIVHPWYTDTSTDDPADKWILTAAHNTYTTHCPDGEHCCEAIGPKIQGNPLGLELYVCVAFNLRSAYLSYLETRPRVFEDLKLTLEDLDSNYSPGNLAEGIVFHHPDGRRAKIRRKDFGYR